MNITRMKRFEKLLRRIKPVNGHRKFDMGSWFSATLSGPPKFTVNPRNGTCEVEHACGTSACALGHAALDPVFQRAGLRLFVCDETEGMPKYKGETDFDAGAAFFGLSYAQSDWLFNPVGYINTNDPKVVAKRVAYLLKHPDFEPNHFNTPASMV